MNNTKFLYQELTGKIIHCCIDVHKELGCGFLEKVYQEALAIVFKEEGKGLSTNDFTDEYKTKVDNSVSQEYVDSVIGGIENGSY